MFSATEDDEFFTPTTSTNLASLFGQNISSSNNEDTDLTYTAPKQRKPQTEILNKEKVEKVTTSVICAKPVYLYKLTDDLYKLIGKYALALIGDINHATEIILYKDKQNILTRAKFVNFQFLLQKDNFLSFTDDNKQKWSMHFEKLTDFEDFACILKIRNISIKECLVKSSKDVHDSKTDLNTNIDHVESLYPKNSSLSIDPESSDSSSSQVRANILSRMAKMGHSILPNPVLGNLRSDSETEDSDIIKKVPRKPKRHHANGKDQPVKSQSFCNENESQICKSTSNLSSTSNSNIKQHTVLNNRQNPIMNDLTQTVPTFPMLINCGTPVYDNLNMYFLENRTHNSEVRMNLSLITSKLDNVLGEISKIEMPSNTDKLENKFLKSVVIDMETELKNKDQEIEKLKETNELLKKSLNESSSLRDKINLLELKEVELNKVIENQNLQLKDLKAFYEENKDNPNLQTNISHLNDKINNLNSKLKDFEHYHHKNETLKNNRKELNDSKIISFSENTKQLMNAMFLHIFCLFENCNDGSNEEIKKKLAVHMKHTTFDIIKDFKNQLKDDLLYEYVLHKNEEGKTNVETVAPPVPSLEV